MKALLIDSDILIEVSRGRNTAILDRWKELSEGESALNCSPVTVAELWHGARPSEHLALEALFGVMHCIAIDIRIGQRAGDYLRQYAHSHHVELGDALIASTALVHSLELWTRNRKHYPMKDVTFF